MKARTKARVGLSFVAVPALFALTPDWAAALPERLDCEALSKGFFKPSMTPQSSVRAVGQACLFTNLRIKVATLQSYSVDQLQVAGLEAWDPEQAPLPARLEIEARGIRFSPDVDSPRVRYQVAVAQKPFDVRFRFDWDGAKRAFHLHEASVKGPALGYLNLGLDATFPSKSLPTATEMTKVQFDHVHLILDNGFVFETMVMPVLIGAIPDGKDPAVEFPRIQTTAERKLRDTPEAVIDRDSRDALIRFTRDFPHPTGHLELDLRLARPRSLEEIKAKKDADWLGDGRITASYQPASAP